MFKIGNHLVCHFDRREKSLNTVSREQRSEGFLIPLRSIRNDITDLGCQNPLGAGLGGFQEKILAASWVNNADNFAGQGGVGHLRGLARVNGIRLWPVL
jgi:hypothetical protein